DYYCDSWDSSATYPLF
nr:immunoglobulin light chain junction region [Macaca mulatta]MOV94443.1 immunoglobulin light chain junction region [Macaca mulatta]MOV94526.1 immunoglobulin light chain junction region [Macaca mulatta]MOV95647.1 immunoglobulin light chain junction region [Macaca mulatta]MOV95710.1 immunoglobulin light chain junction region [Macaca mulatta]